MRIRDGENFGLSLRKTRRHDDTMVDITIALGSGHADKGNALEDTDGLVQSLFVVFACRFNTAALANLN